MKIKKPIDNVKSEHLDKGVKPIMACVGSFDDFGYIERNNIRRSFRENQEGSHDVNFLYPTTFYNRKNFLNQERAFTISTVDNFDKFSELYIDCTGLIVTGKDKISGENISFLTHQNPDEILSANKSSFIESLKKRLDQVKEKCRKGTIDAVIIGGNYIVVDKNKKEDLDEDKKHYKKQYLESIKLLTEEIKKFFDFEPVVINGPKLTTGTDNVYYDNKHRKLYFMRQQVNPVSGDFLMSKVAKEKRGWEKELKNKKSNEEK